MTEFEKVLMRRDDMTAEEAATCRKNARDEIYKMFDDDFSDFEVEDYLLDQYGLEMDYIFDILLQAGGGLS